MQPWVAMDVHASERYHRETRVFEFDAASKSPFFD